MNTDLLPLHNGRASIRLGRLIGALLLIAAAGLWGCRARPSAEVRPSLVLDPPPAHAEASLQALAAVDPPARDLIALARALRGVEPAAVARAIPAVGDRETFWYRRGGETSVQTDATLVYQSAGIHFWLEDGARVRERDWQQAAEWLENEIFPTTRAFFGREASPGIDGDARIHILHLKEIGGAGDGTTALGYFYAADQVPRNINPFSNEREMFYISLKQAPVGSDAYYQVIAHEFQHMIQANTDPNEPAWVDEGLAELSNYINGYFSPDSVRHYARLPDVQLNDWQIGSADSLAHYGASFLFAAYFLERFGRDAMRAVVASPADGFHGFADGLRAAGSPLTTDALFADWTAANYLAGSGRMFDRYRYDSVTVPAVALSGDYARLPAALDGSVAQYGADYLRIQSGRPVSVTFTGSLQTTLLPTRPQSGEWFWTTYPADRSAMALTRPFDLTAVAGQTATLSFWTWYAIETGWDYGYVLASADPETGWEMLPSIYATRANPQGNNYGIGLTGKSGAADEPVWTQVSVDLTAYAGQTVWLRFLYVTDDAVSEAGWAIDDVAIPQIGYFEDFERGPGGWEAEGWIHHANVLPQRYIVQVIYFGRDAARVERLEPDASNQGVWTLDLNEATDSAVLIISGATPVTALRAPYRLEIR